MKHSRAPWGSIWTRFLGFGLGYDLNQEPGESLTHWQSPQWMKNPRGLTLVGLTSVVGYFGIFLALDPTSLWKKIPINCSLGRWRSLQSLAQLLRWCCWKRRRGLQIYHEHPWTSMNGILCLQPASPVQHFLALLILRLFYAPAALFSTGNNALTLVAKDFSTFISYEHPKSSPDSPVRLSDMILSLPWFLPRTSSNIHKEPAPLATGLPGSLPMPSACWRLQWPSMARALSSVCRCNSESARLTWMILGLYFDTKIYEQPHWFAEMKSSIDR